VTDDETVWRWIAEERVALADALEALPAEAWDEPSQCRGWKVRDVVGHLVSLAEATRWSVTVDLARQLRLPDEALSRIAKREGRADPTELVARLHAAARGRFVVFTQPPAVSLGEVIVHGIDALRPVGGDEPAVDPERTLEVAQAYRNVGFVFSAGRVTRKIRFEATDAGWVIGPTEGPVAQGAATDVLLALAGRAEGCEALGGPGADLLLS